MNTTIDAIKREIYAGYGEHIAATKNEKELEQSVSKIKKQMETEDNARIFFQKQAEDLQSETADILAGILTAALQAAFPDTYVCEIPFTIKRNQLEATPILKKGSLVIKNPMDSIGGGLVDVLSLAAKVADIYLSNRRLVLIADEPFTAVSSLYRRFIPEMLKMLHEKLGFQFIIVTHLDELINCGETKITVKKGKVIDVEYGSTKSIEAKE